MSGAPKRKMTTAEYLEIERKAAHKSEFYDGEMFAMAGANNEHNIVKENLVGEMFNRLKGTSCRSYSNRKWTVSMHHSLTENFALASIPIEIPMADLYRDVTLPPTA